MQNIIILLGVLFVIIGCANVRMEAPKDPIKLDVSMRLDVYQHVQSDIDKIENSISAPSKEHSKPLNKISLLDCFIGNAYAQELSPEAMAAISHRQARHDELIAWEQKGIVGENRSGLVVIRGAGAQGAQALVSDENNDRMTIYKAVAEKNGTSLDSVESLYAKRLQSDAPSGTAVESESGWAVK